jgi:hypothetical protein
VLGLSLGDLAGIRESLAAGKQPRVVFTARAGQMAGNAGHVVELADPDGSDEWIVVRFGRDELPFAPADLAVSRRGQATLAEPAKAPTVQTQPARVAPVRASPHPRPTARREETTVPGRRTPTASEAVIAPLQEAPVQKAPVQTAPIQKTPDETAAQKAPRQPRPAKTPAPLVVTLTYADQRWTVSAQHGSKSLAKPYAIAPTEALRMVALVQVPGVHDAIAGILAAERAAAESRAQRLRAELAEIESRLAELSKRP